MVSKLFWLEALIWSSVVLLSLDAVDSVEEQLDILIGHLALSIDLAVEVKGGSKAWEGDCWGTWGVDQGWITWEGLTSVSVHLEQNHVTCIGNEFITNGYTFLLVDSVSISLMGWVSSDQVSEVESHDEGGHVDDANLVSLNGGSIGWDELRNESEIHLYLLAIAIQK